ncbi:MAG TPA: hypothetical protein VHN18_19900 [Micromonosporaceae bacterium]|nr:hypothetical protein [Micromonosporaceae bacterium]
MSSNRAPSTCCAAGLGERLLGERLLREGMRHEGIELRFDGRSHRVPMAELTGRAITSAPLPTPPERRMVPAATPSGPR